MTDRSERTNHSPSPAEQPRRNAQRSRSGASTRIETHAQTGADRVREHRETLEALAESDLPAAWIAEALLEWIRTDGASTPSRDS